MAAGNPLQSLREEATCSICLSFFQEPVSLDCGHSFCQACISHCWQGSEANISCPQCRETFPQRTLRPNRHLGNIVAITKQLSGQLGGGEDLCPAHQEAFKLFCDQDRVLICVICRESQAHRAHTVLPREEAAQAYKAQIQARLSTLKTEREELLAWKQAVERQSQDYLRKIEAERQTIVSEFEQLRLFLEKQEQLLLAQLDELNKKMVNLQADNINKLSEEISRLGNLISEIEEKLKQPAGEFLRDIKRTWSSCEKKWQEPVAVPQDLQDRLTLSAQRKSCLQEALKKFKEALPYQLSFLITKAEKKVQATPEPDLTHPCSLLSREQRVVYQNQAMGLVKPVDAETRFHPAACVLGYKDFTCGRCYWELEVGNKRQWILGLAKESVIRAGVTTLTPEQGIWALQSTGSEFRALTSPNTALDLPAAPRIMGVYLDYEGQKVTFYGVTPSGREPVFTFPASFTGKIVPFFGSRPVRYQDADTLQTWLAQCQKADTLQTWLAQCQKAGYPDPWAAYH
ncbi:zinc finger protein RFP-like [Carettochelys insculpta]|uniref:zinc finger protein RFP-like n=1 Tax=Carettochelys insculpta TaxID=44489 RepID=UPI003EB88EA6